MMVFPFLRFPARRRLRVFEAWISRRRVGLGTKAPGEALLRKCINPLRYFHPEAAKYRGLSEGDAASAEAYAGDMMLFRITSPARAAWICGCPVLESHAVVFSQPPSEAQLPSSGRWGLREKCVFPDPCFSKNAKRGLVISHEIGYTVCRVKRKATVSRLLQQAIWKRSFFMCGLSFRGPQPSAVQSSGIPPFFDSASSDFLCASPSQMVSPLIWLCQIFQNTG